MPFVKLTPAQEARIAQMYRENFEIPVIAERFGVHRNRIYCVLESQGLRPVRPSTAKRQAMQARKDSH